MDVFLGDAAHQLLQVALLRRELEIHVEPASDCALRVELVQLRLRQRKSLAKDSAGVLPEARRRAQVGLRRIG